MTSFLQTPDLLIYIRAQVPTLVRQIQQRGREYENTIRIEYLERLNRLYENWIDDYPHEKLIIDSDDIDFVNNQQDLGSVIALIEQRLFGLFNWLQVNPIIHKFGSCYIMSKLVFNIVEIPEGESRRTEQLGPEDLELDLCNFKEGHITLDFYRTLHFIRLQYEVEAQIELTCDRSLEPYVDTVNSRYEVIFKTDVQEETEDEEGAVRAFDFSTNTFSIEDEVRGSIMLEVPMQKIHPKYLDENNEYKDFKTKSFGDIAEDDEPTIDPRWEKLKEL